MEHQISPKGFLLHFLILKEFRHCWRSTSQTSWSPVLASHWFPSLFSCSGWAGLPASGPRKLSYPGPAAQVRALLLWSALRPSSLWEVSSLFLSDRHIPFIFRCSCVFQNTVVPRYSSLGCAGTRDECRSQ